MLVPLIIGVTGTEVPAYVTKLALKTFDNFLLEWGVKELHHGDCIGGDKAMNDIALIRGVVTVGHPPLIIAKRAYCIVSRFEPAKPYLDRNKDIAKVGERLIAMPAQRTEVRRSGTWSTVRYARAMKKPVFIIFPDGDFRGEMP